MRHGIDLKTHSQCQRQRPMPPTGPWTFIRAGSRIFILENIEAANQHLALRRPGGASRDRTDDLKLAKLALSQLSYGPLQDARAGMVGRGGLEPPTLRLSGVRSNHLSYRPLPGTHESTPSWDPLPHLPGPIFHKERRPRAA